MRVFKGHILHETDRLDDDVDLLLALPDRALFERLAGLDLSSGELPTMPEGGFLQTLGNQELTGALAFALNDGRDDFDGFWGFHSVLLNDAIRFLKTKFDIVGSPP